MVEDNYPPAEDAPPSGKLPTWAWVLIGCGGAAVLLFVLLIIAAIAVPLLRPTQHHLSSETSAVASLRSYAAAQAVYRKTNHEYAVFCSKLYNSDPSLSLIDQDFANANGPRGTPKRGYLFQECATIGGQPIDWTVEFAICAKPANYQRTGTRTFIVGSDGTVYAKDNGGAFLDDFPADPVAEGWRVAE